MADQFASVEQAKVILQRADAVWRPAVEAFDPYVDRLRRLSHGADQQRRALLVAELSDAPWKPIDTGSNFSLAEHLETGKRPGPDGLWADFDKATKRLGKAFAGDGHEELAAAFGSLSKAAAALADKLAAMNFDKRQPRQQTG